MAKKTKKDIVKYDIHVGHMIRNLIEADRSVSKKDVADKLSITYPGLANKFNTPHYGSIYDVIDISKILDINILTRISNEVYGGNAYTLQQEIMQLREENVMYKRVIKNYTDKQ